MNHVRFPERAHQCYKVVCVNRTGKGKEGRNAPRLWKKVDHKSSFKNIIRKRQSEGHKIQAQVSHTRKEKLSILYIYFFQIRDTIL